MQNKFFSLRLKNYLYLCISNFDCEEMLKLAKF